MRGQLIALEGPDGSGRTSQARRLADWLQEEGRTVVLLRLKGSELAREDLRELQSRSDISEQALFLLYAADLADLLHFEAEPALAAGGIVLFDRYLLTPVVRAAASGIDRNWAEAALSFAPRPDLTILLDAPARVRVERLLGRRRFLQPREAGSGGPAGSVLTRAVRHQARLGRLYREIGGAMAAHPIDTARPPEAVQQDLQRLLTRFLSDRRVLA